MSGWKQPSVLSRNKSELNACIMILETNKQEGEEYLFYSYKTNDTCGELVNLKGIILASVGISNSIFGDDYKMLIFQNTLPQINNKNSQIPNLSNNNYQDLYKACSKSYLKNYIVSIIMPCLCPDNIIMYVCKEFIEFLNFFFENFEDTKKFVDIMNKYSDILFYNTLNYSMHKDKEDILGSPLSLMPLINITFSYNETIPCFLVKPPLNDNLRTELIEIINTLNSDRSVLQETLTLMDPPFYIRGCCLLYKGFVLYNSLNNRELSNLSRLAMLHEMYQRGPSSCEVLSCEFIFENENIDTFNSNNGEKKKILTTILAQREFVLLIYLDILGKNNSSFDPFYHKRAEDLLITVLKKGYNAILSNELNMTSIRMIEDKNNIEENIFRDMDSEGYGITGRKNSESSVLSKKDSKKNLKIETNNIITHSKLKGFIDHESNVNIIHFSCYDDAECVINTADVNVSATIYKEIYRYIFKEYAKIQSNINKLKTRNKNLRLRKIFQYENISKNYSNVLKRETVIKTKMIREQFLKNLNLMKINEYAIKINVDSNIPIWVCCKLYEHTTIQDEANLDEYANYKIIFVSYESHSPVDLDSFCQDLLINELFS